ncbi:MAG: COG2426 family protein [Minisyncoccia bacterium]
MYISKELIIFLISMSPLSELRGAIPLALIVYHFPVWKAFLISIIGNSLIIIPVIFFLEKVSDWLMKKSKLFNYFFNWLFKRTRLKIEGNYKKYSKWALTIFVAIPLPMTGAWTGSVAAYLLGLNKKEALLYIGLGVLLAGLIVTVLTLVGR